MYGVASFHHHLKANFLTLLSSLLLMTFAMHVIIRMHNPLGILHHQAQFSEDISATEEVII